MLHLFRLSEIALLDSGLVVEDEFISTGVSTTHGNCLLIRIAILRPLRFTDGFKSGGGSMTMMYLRLVQKELRSKTES